MSVNPWLLSMDLCSEAKIHLHRALLCGIADRYDEARILLHGTG